MAVNLHLAFSSSYRDIVQKPSWTSSTIIMANLNLGQGAEHESDINIEDICTVPLEGVSTLSEPDLATGFIAFLSAVENHIDPSVRASWRFITSLNCDDEGITWEQRNIGTRWLVLYLCETIFWLFSSGI